MFFSNQLTKLNCLDLVFFQTELTSSFSKNAELIQHLWKRFNTDLHKIKNREVDTGWKKFGLTFKINGQYTYFTAIENSKDLFIPLIFDQFTLEELNYFLFEHEGNLLSIKNSITKAFVEVESNKEFNFHKSNQSGVMMIERYDKRFNWNKPNSIIEILIPVERAI